MRPQAISVGDANAVHFLLALTIDERRKPGEMLVIVAKLQAPFTSAHIITTSSWRPRRSRGIAGRHRARNLSSEQESGDRVRVEGSYRRRHSKVRFFV